MSFEKHYKKDYQTFADLGQAHDIALERFYRYGHEDSSKRRTYNRKVELKQKDNTIAALEAALLQIKHGLHKVARGPCIYCKKPFRNAEKSHCEGCDLPLDEFEIIEKALETDK